ncbi:phage portal protein [Bacteroides sedimenti]|uniref:phage portal protein n=1 Tax=Bacteroides sedimenti TaxID=2136147 RepID=UPI00333F3856
MRYISSDDPFLNEYFDLIGSGAANNINVTSGDSAMSLATVFRCVSILSGTIASLPLEIRRKKSRHYEVDTEHELYPIFSWMASGRQTFYELLENAIIEMYNEGNAYILIKRKRGEVSELVLCNRGSVNYDKFTHTYRIHDWVNGINGVYEAWQVIHLKNKSIDGGYTGVSTISYAARTMNVTANADQQTLNELKGGNRMKGFVTGGDIASGMGKYQDKQTDIVKERLKAELAAGENIMRLPAGVDFRQLSITPADAQLLETRKFSVFEICRFYGVHPDKVFAEASSNYKASENSQVSFLTDTLQPVLAKIEAEFSAKLIPKNLIGKYRIKFDISALYQVDLDTKSKYYKQMQEIGAFTTNEIRQKENLPPVDGGDIAFVSCNIAPIDSAKIRGEKPEDSSAEGKKEPPEKPITGKNEEKDKKVEENEAET